MELSNDKRVATVRIDQELDAEGLHDLINQLAVLRSQMQPQVASEPPQDAEGFVLDVACERDGGFAITRSAGGRFLLLLRHRGLGWIGVELPADRAAVLRDILTARAGDEHQRAPVLTEDSPVSGERPQ